MASRIRIAVDCMGGDSGLRVSLPAVHLVLSQFSDIDITLVGDEKAIEQQLGSNVNNFTIVHAAQVVEMSDKPSQVLRKKPQSSMHVALNLLKQKQVDSVVSAGNTGALMAIGCLVLRTLPGISRPAICSAVPAAGGHCHLLDLGANVDSSAKQLHQFALMGSALAVSLDNIQRPRVALLNIGEEDTKGNEQVKLADKLILADPSLNYVGFIEGDGIFKGEADVVVADGFVGNVALKVCEGTASYISATVKQAFGDSWFTKLAGFFAFPVLKALYRQLDPQQYNGASLLGLSGVVIKSHGASTVAGFANAISQARTEVNANLLAAIVKQLPAVK